MDQDKVIIYCQYNVGALYTWPFMLLHFIVSTNSVANEIFLSLHGQSIQFLSLHRKHDQESRQHPVLLDTKPDLIAAAILNLYGIFWVLALNKCDKT